MKEPKYRVVVHQVRGDDLAMDEQSGYMPRPSALLQVVSYIAARRRAGFQVISMRSQDYALLKRGDAEIEVKLEREAHHEPAH